mmetsp:Transcript_56931/g.176630  ORF Transcript_56931/g.176630 Transcript_56931/m.176630 type:complete len:363 (+) Transcript_56931:491-1579(+)
MTLDIVALLEPGAKAPLQHADRKRVCDIRIVFVVPCCLDAAVDEQNPNDKPHPLNQVQEIGQCRKKAHPENHRTQDAYEERPVDEFPRCFVRPEDEVEYEQVVHRQQPLQDVARAPLDAGIRTVPVPDDNVEDPGHEHPEDERRQVRAGAAHAHARVGTAGLTLARLPEALEADGSAFWQREVSQPRLRRGVPASREQLRPRGAALAVRVAPAEGLLQQRLVLPGSAGGPARRQRLQHERVQEEQNHHGHAKNGPVSPVAQDTLQEHAGLKERRVEYVLLEGWVLDARRGPAAEEALQQRGGAADGRAAPRMMLRAGLPCRSASVELVLARLVEGNCTQWRPPAGPAFGSAAVGEVAEAAGA